MYQGLLATSEHTYDPVHDGARIIQWNVLRTW
jgi:hypothetical protein